MPNLPTWNCTIRGTHKHDRICSAHILDNLWDGYCKSITHHFIMKISKVIDQECHSQETVDSSRDLRDPRQGNQEYIWKDKNTQTRSENNVYWHQDMYHEPNPLSRGGPAWGAEEPASTQGSEGLVWCSLLRGKLIWEQHWEPEERVLHITTILWYRWQEKGVQVHMWSVHRPTVRTHCSIVCTMPELSR